MQLLVPEPTATNCISVCGRTFTLIPHHVLIAVVVKAILELERDKRNDGDFICTNVDIYQS